MTETTETFVRRLLRDSEELKQLLEAEIAPIRTDNDDSDSEAGPPGSYSSKAQPLEPTDDKKRVLAIVAHIDPYGDEQGCAFILRPKSARSSEPASQEYSVEQAFPILSGFTIAMAQTRRNTIDLTSATITTLKQSQTEFALTLYPGHDRTVEPVHLITYDVQHLRAVLAECKRLKDVSIANNELGAIPPYPWIMPYISQAKSSVLSPEPQDLRHVRRPVLELLSDAFAGSPGDDTLDISIIREHWIRSQVENTYRTATEPARLKLRIGTFNVNGKMPSQDLSAWVGGRLQTNTSKYIPPLTQISSLSLGEVSRDPMDKIDMSSLASISDESSASTMTNPSNEPAASSEMQDPDLIVLGFQELDLSAGALLYSTETTREDAWVTAALAGLGEKAVDYEKLASKQLVGMLVVVIVKRSITQCFTRIQATSVGAGIMGLMGNKGATALRLTFQTHPTKDAPNPRPVVITFVNAHLAAFDDMYEKRNADFQDISKRLLFDSGVPAVGAASPQTGYATPTVSLNVYQSDALFWMGDLNYRVDLSDSDVRTLLSDEAVNNVPLLLQYDQLGIAMRTGKAFADFIEHPLSHPPSYRYNAAALSDGLGYDVKRKPAWTDRILHIQSHAVRVLQRTYVCHKEITMSDHRPVSATFELHIPTVDVNKLESLVHELWKEVSYTEESEDIPRVGVEPNMIDLGKIGYRREVRRSVLVRNIGRVPLVYRIVPLSPGGSIHPDWLRVEPKAGLVRPGSHEELAVYATVDARLASELNLKGTALEATLVLHTSLGKDNFLVVTAEYEPTCFAMSIPRLVRMAGPVSTFAAQPLLPEDQAATAPKEFMRLVSWLMSNASDVDQLFVAQGDPRQIDDIRQALDLGKELPEPTEESRSALALSVASCLFQFLEALPEPLVPTHLHQVCAESLDREAAFELLNDFPSACVNAWISLTSLLHFICQQGTRTTDTMKAQNLAAKFAPVLLRDSTTSAKAVSPVGKRRFVLHFIS